jgi:hypothetical protein
MPRDTYEEDRFPGHPPDWQQDFTRCREVVGRVKVVTDAVVGHFDRVMVADETVPCRQVAVNKIKFLEVLHPRRNLGREVNQATVAEKEKYERTSSHFDATSSQRRTTASKKHDMAVRCRFSRFYWPQTLVALYVGLHEVRLHPVQTL